MSLNVSKLGGLELGNVRSSVWEMDISEIRKDFTNSKVGFAIHTQATVYMRPMRGAASHK